MAAVLALSMVLLAIPVTAASVTGINFTDTFSTPNWAAHSTNGSVSPAPGGASLAYPGFKLTAEISDERLVTPSPPFVIQTDSEVQWRSGNQPMITRQTNTSSFDLESLAFACTDKGDKSNNHTILPSCLVTFICKPIEFVSDGTPSGRRPTPRSTVRDTFVFTPDLDRSSLSWPGPEDPLPAPKGPVKASLYSAAKFSAEFYDLDYCYVVLEQYATRPEAGSFVTPILFIDQVKGMAYPQEKSKEKVPFRQSIRVEA